MNRNKNWLLLGLSVIAIAAVGFWLFSDQGNGTDAKEIVVVSYGGSFQEAQRKAFFEPFEKETGIKVKEVQWSGEFAKLKAMVESKNIEWDLLTAAESSIIARGINEGLLEKIDYTNIDRSAFFPKSTTDYSLGTNYYSTAMAINTDLFPDGNYPESWKDFWDIDKFPGKRCLRKDPRTTLEFALLADGVPAEELYPLDLDRAFESLDRIAPHVSVWWSSGHQPAQLLADKEVALASAFNGRIWAAVKNEHVPLKVLWNGGALDVDAWIIPKGCENYESVMKLVEFTSRPKVQMDLTNYISYSPTIPAAFEAVTVDNSDDLPTSPQNYKKQFVFNGEWWAKNEQKVLERWNEWLLRQ